MDVPVQSGNRGQVGGFPDSDILLGVMFWAHGAKFTVQFNSGGI